MGKWRQRKIRLLHSTTPSTFNHSAHEPALATLQRVRMHPTATKPATNLQSDPRATGSFCSPKPLEEPSHGHKWLRADPHSWPRQPKRCSIYICLTMLLKFSWDNGVLQKKKKNLYRSRSGCFPAPIQIYGELRKEWWQGCQLKCYLLKLEIKKKKLVLMTPFLNTGSLLGRNY